MVFLSVFSLVFLAELGDKTQLLMVSLASRYGLWRILGGVLPAIVLLSLLGTGVGGLLSAVLSAGIIRFFSALAFLIFALLCLRREEEKTEKRSRGSVFFIFFTFFLAELGDKTQFSVIASSASALPGERWQVALGGMAGLVLADAVGIFIGRLLKKRVNDRIFSALSYAVFTLFGFFGLYRALPAVCGGSFFLWLTGAAFLFALLSAGIYRNNRRRKNNEKTDRTGAQSLPVHRFQ